MGNSSKDELQLRVWENTARRIRRVVAEKLQSILVGYEPRFGGRDESLALGTRFWMRAKEIPEQIVDDFTAGWQSFNPALWPGEREVVFFHNQTNECGVLFIPLNILLKKAKELRDEFGPDFLFMEINEEFGFCFEQGEYEAFIRCW